MIPAEKTGTFHIDIKKETEDAVSRIVDNLGFTSIERGAHSKLVNIMIGRLTSFGSTLRLMMENAGKAPSDATESDVFHLFKFQKVNIEQLVDYVEQVLPFSPPEPDYIPDSPAKIVNMEKHGERERSRSEIVERAAEPPVVAKDNLQLHEKKLKFKKKREPLRLPDFTGMDAYDLGFATRTVVAPSASSHSTNYIPQQQVFSNDNDNDNIAIPSSSSYDESNQQESLKPARTPAQSKINNEFNNNYFTPLLGRRPKPSKSTPEVRAAAVAPQYGQQQQPKEQKPVQRAAKNPPARSKMPLWQKKIYQQNHERRLREEMMLADQKRILASKKRQLEVSRKSTEKDQYGQTTSELKNYYDSVAMPPPSRYNEQKDGESAREPLLKMNITFKNFNGGVIIKNLSTTKYRLTSAGYKPMKRSARLPTGKIVSYEIPRKRSIPKIKFQVLKNGTIIKKI